MTLSPLHDNILILPEPPKESTGMIQLLDTKNTKAETGVVVATGPGAYDTKHGRVIPLTVAVGDRVAFQKASIMHELPVNGVPHYVMKEGQITGIIRD